MARYGYIVELNDGTSMEKRLDAMRSVDPDDVVIETAPARPKLSRLLKRLHAGDSLVVESIFALGSNMAGIAGTVRQLHQKKGVNLILLDVPVMAERPSDDPLQSVVSELVMQTVLYMAQHQKEMREQQQRRGIDSAMTRGVQFGRPKLDMPEEYDEVVERWRSGEITSAEAARAMHISRSTFWRRLNAEQGRTSLPASQL